MSEDEEIYAVPKLQCTLCQHDLNHPIYEVCRHPLLDVPLCSECHQNVLLSDIMNQEADKSEMCTWCGDGGELFLCSDEKDCNRAFCRDCLTINLGEEAVDTIEDSDDWQCLCCDDIPLEPFREAMEIGIRNSIYSHTLVLESAQHDDGDEKKEQSESLTEEERAVARDTYILRRLVQESDAAAKQLEDGELKEKLRLITDELRTMREGSVYEEAHEELAAWKAHWTRHYDILQSQEAVLFDRLYSMGYDPRQFEEYDASDAALAKMDTALEKEAWRAAEAALSQAVTTPLKRSSSSSSSAAAVGNDEVGTKNGETSAHKRHRQPQRKPIEWTESVVEIDTEGRLPALEAAAVEDALVQMYALDSEQYPPMDPARYPASFAAILPVAVINAFCHASASERRELMERYSIPAHVRIILSMLSAHSESDFPYSTDRWSFATTVHPAVRLALFYAESPTQIAILVDHYQLSEHNCGVIDFGSTEEVLGTYSATLAVHNARNKEMAQMPRPSRLTRRQLCDAEENETRNDSYMLEDYFASRREDFGDDGGGSGIGQKRSLEGACSCSLSGECNSSCNCAMAQQRQREKIQRLLKPSVKTDVEDEVECQKERRRHARLLQGQHKPKSDKKKKEKSQKASKSARASPVEDQGGAVAGGSNGGGGDGDAHQDDGTVPSGNQGTDEKRDAPSATFPEQPAIESGIHDDEHMEVTVDEPLPTSEEEPPQRNTSAQPSPPSAPAPPACTASAQKGSSAADPLVIDLCDTDEENDAPHPSAPHTTSATVPAPTPVMDLVDDDGPVDAAEAPSAEGPRGPVFKPKLPPRPAQLSTQPREISSTIVPVKLDVHRGAGAGAGGSGSCGDGSIRNFFEPRTGPFSASAGGRSTPAAGSGSKKEVGDGSGSDSVGLIDTDQEGAKRKRGRPFGSTNKAKKSKELVLSEETLQVQQEEKQRLRELRRNAYFESDDGFALNNQRPEEDPAVVLIPQIAQALKDHQKEGVRFLWNNVFGSVSRAKKDANSGSGCILAHCMGLGKTLSVIAFTSTLLTNPAIVSIEDPYQPTASGGSAGAVRNKGMNGVATQPVGATNTASVPPASSSTAAAEANATPSDETKGADTTPTTATAATEGAPTQNPALPAPKKRLIHTVLIVAPKNTLENWLIEFKKWVPPDLQSDLRVSSVICGANEKGGWKQRLQRLRDWHENGGIMVLGYDMYRILTNLESAKLKNAGDSSGAGSGDGAIESTTSSAGLSSAITSNAAAGNGRGTGGVTLANIHEARRYLQNPGPDLVIADEAHTIKEKTAKISKVMSEIRSRRRIALTGSPLQNNLVEYWCMVNWVKTRFLGDFTEFTKYYVEPIRVGSDKRATSSQVRKMKNRTHILNKKLLPIVDRKDTRVLEKDLPPKREFVISVRMTPFQKYLYKLFLSLLAELSSQRKLLIGYNCLQRVWNHPACAVMNHHRVLCEDEREASKKAGRKSSSGVGSSSSGGGVGGIGKTDSSGALVQPTADAVAGGGTGSASAGPSAPTDGANAASDPAVTTAAPIAAPVARTIAYLGTTNNGSSIPKLNLHYIREQLDSTIRHFRANSAALLAEVEQAASQTENAMLTQTRGEQSKNASSGAGVPDQGVIALDESDADDASYDTAHSRSPSTGTHTETDNDGDGSDDGSDLNSFVVDDDVIEYEDGHVSDIGSDTASSAEESEDSEFRPDGHRRRRKHRTHKVKNHQKRRKSAGSGEKDGRRGESGGKRRRTIVATASPVVDAPDAIAAAIAESAHPGAAHDGGNASVPAHLREGAEHNTAEVLAANSTASASIASPAPPSNAPAPVMFAPASLSLTTPLEDARLRAEELLRRASQPDQSPHGGDGDAADQGAIDPVLPEGRSTAATPSGDAKSPFAFGPETAASPVGDDILASAAAEDEGEIEALTRQAIPSDWWRYTGPDEGDVGISDTQGSSSSSSGAGRRRLALDNLALLQLSHKMATLLTLIALSVLQGDKVLVFSQSLYSLDCIEFFLGMPHWDRLIDCVQAGRFEKRRFSEWRRNTDFLRIDGSVSQRQSLIDRFNRPGAKFHLMLLSTKAGNMGINLQAANRVVIFDTSWNPVHDLQAMYRAYRYGQRKPVFVYRLLSAGSMEERIYRLQVRKQSLSARVVDAQMPDNHFNEEELMVFEDNDSTGEGLARAETVLSSGVEDRVLSDFVRHFGTEMLVSIEDHGGLLEDNVDAHLTAEEQKQAEEELEVEMRRVSEETLQAQREALNAGVPLSALPSGAAAAAAPGFNGAGRSISGGGSGMSPNDLQAVFDPVRAAWTSGGTGRANPMTPTFRAPFPFALPQGNPFAAPMLLQPPPAGQPESRPWQPTPGMYHGQSFNATAMNPASNADSSSPRPAEDRRHSHQRDPEGWSKREDVLLLFALASGDGWERAVALVNTPQPGTSVPGTRTLLQLSQRYNLLLRTGLAQRYLNMQSMQRALEDARIRRNPGATAAAAPAAIAPTAMPAYGAVPATVPAVSIPAPAAAASSTAESTVTAPPAPDANAGGDMT